jgi:CRISPR/Cas system CSM-associated protein Csm2 small subunit
MPKKADCNEDAVVRDYENGLPQKLIMKHHEICLRRLYDILERNGVEKRNKWKKAALQIKKIKTKKCVCACCRKKFEPYIYEFQRNETLCLECFLGHEKDE